MQYLKLIVISAVKPVHLWEVVMYLFLKVMCLWAMVLPFTYGEALAAKKSMSPLSSLPASDFQFSMYMLENSFVDPKISKSIDGYDANQEASMTYEIEMALKEYKFAQKIRKQELAWELFNSYGRLCHMMALNPDPSKANLDKLKTCRKNTVTFANRILKSNPKSKFKKSELAYNVIINKYLSNPGKQTSLMNSLRKLAESKHLRPQLKRRAILLVAIHDIKYRDNSHKQKAAKQLSRLVKSLNLEGAMLARLSIAQVYAKVNRKGHSYGKADNNYRPYLANIVMRVKKLPAAEQDRVIAHSVNIWSKAEGRKIDWRRPPFKMSRIAEHSVVVAINERAAIENYKKGNFTRAVKDYKKLANDQNKNQVAERILEIRMAQYKKSKNFTHYEKELMALRNDCQDNEISGNACKQAMLQHKALVMVEISKGMKSKKFLNRSIALTNRYLGVETDVASRETIAYKLGLMFVKAKQHANAVAIFDELAKNGSVNQRSKYLAKAIESQIFLANWSKNPPFYKLNNGNLQARELLLNLYTRLGEQSSNKVDWHIIAQRGLLLGAVGKRNEGYQLWRQTLETNFQEKNARVASGLMHITFKKEKNWTALEDLTRFSLARGVQPFYGKKNLNLNELLALALFEGGKQAIAENKHKDGVKKLEDFIESYSSDPRNPEAYYLLSSGYQGIGEHTKAVDILMAITEKYPKSKFFKQAIIKGGDLSINMALEEHAIRFHELFLDRYTNDTQALSFAKRLHGLYLGRKLFAEAMGVNQKISRMNSADANTKANAHLSNLEMTYKYGAEDQSIQKAETYVKQKGSDDSGVADSLSILNRHYYRNTSVKQLESNEKKLSMMDQTNQKVAFALSEARFFIAESQKNEYEEEIYSPALKDPMGTLKKFQAAGENIEQKYTSVCEVPSSAYCAPAMFQIARRFDKYVDLVTQITVADTLAKEEVDKFNALKTEIINTLSHKAMALDERAQEEAKAGHTHPNWTPQILWLSSSQDLEQFDAVDGSLAFVEWDGGEL